MRVHVLDLDTGTNQYQTGIKITSDAQVAIQQNRHQSRNRRSMLLFGVGGSGITRSNSNILAFL